ncbi:hypothetical protein ACM6Q4_18260 [Bacillus pumilus]
MKKIIQSLTEQQKELLKLALIINERKENEQNARELHAKKWVV